MRTKTLLGMAALAVSALTAVAQSNVYSLNIVGYVNVPVQANKFYMLGNPLDTMNGNNISNVINLDATFDGTLLYPWTASGYGNAESYIAGFGWFPAETTLAPGSGFFIQPTAAGTITFVGQVTTSKTQSLPSGFTMTASAFPASLSLFALGLTGQDGDLVYRFDPVSGYGPAVSYIAGYGWFDGGTDTNGPALNVGEGFFYFNNQATAYSWVQNFTVN